MEGRTIVNFLSGYCVDNAGHNPPAPAHDFAASPANRLCDLASGRLGSRATVAGEELRGKLKTALAGGNNFMALKAPAPLVATGEQMDRFAAAARSVADEAHSAGSFRTEALGMARRVVNV